MKINGDWGLGIGDWGLGIGPNPQSPIPNPHIDCNCLYNIIKHIILNIKINEYFIIRKCLKK